MKRFIFATVAFVIAPAMACSPEETPPPVVLVEEDPAAASLPGEDLDKARLDLEVALREMEMELKRIELELDPVDKPGLAENHSYALASLRHRMETTLAEIERLRPRATGDLARTGEHVELRFREFDQRIETMESALNSAAIESEAVAELPPSFPK